VAEFWTLGIIPTYEQEAVRLAFAGRGARVVEHALSRACYCGDCRVALTGYHDFAQR